MKTYKIFLLAFAFGMMASCLAQTAEEAAPPISSPPKYSAAELEKLVGPIALYPDPLIASILPASTYPVEIVQAARFVQDTNNLDKLDDQPWDDDVKAVSRVPAVIEMMNTNLSWTVDLGQAFMEQQEEVMDTIQSLRAKAQGLGNLKTTPEQVVVVTNMVIEKTVEQKIVYVTNTIVQVMPANPQVIYVPMYHPYYVYYRPPPYYAGPPPIVTFAAGVTVGLILANNCNWYYRGVYVGRHGMVVWRGGSYRGHGNVNININKNVNINRNRPRPPTTQYSGQSTATANTMNQKWQPDAGRANKAGAAGSPATAESRGWNTGGSGTQTGNAASRPSGTGSTKQPVASTQPARPTGSTQPAQRPNSGGGAAPSTGTSRQTTGTQPAPQPSNRGGASKPSGQSAFGDIPSGQSERGYGSRGSNSRSGNAPSGNARSGGKR